MMGTIMMDLNELQIFAQVSKMESFTRAGQELGIPKSTVSRAISSLESRLGLRLVERTTRKVKMTDAGELYLSHCQRMIEEAEQAEVAISALHTKPRGRLRIGAPVAFARFVLSPILPDFLQQNPGVNCSLQLLNGHGPAQEHALDVVIRPGPLEDTGLLLKPLMKIRLGLYASPLYLKNHPMPNSPASLRGHRCITTGCGALGEPADSSVWKLRQRTQMEEVRVEAHVSVSDPSINYQLAVAGVGIASLAQRVAQPDVQRKKLIRILSAWEPDGVELYAVYSTPLNLSPKLRVFLEFLQQRLSMGCDKTASREMNMNEAFV
jgi:DNA-binding transcriptional LysR family regulator